MDTRVSSATPSIVKVSPPSTDWQLALDRIQRPYAAIYDEAEFGQNLALDAMSRRDMAVMLHSLEFPKPLDGKKILVGGTGTGREVLALLQQGAEVIGLDVTLEYLEKTQEKILSFDSSLIDRVTLLHCPLEEYSIPVATFDGASALFGVLNHVECWENALELVAHGLKPGARFVFSVYGTHEATVFKLLAEGKLPYKPSIVQRRVPGGIVLGDSAQVLPAKFPTPDQITEALTQVGMRVVETQGYLDVAALFPQAFAELEAPAPETLEQFRRVIHELDPRYDQIVAKQNGRTPSEIINALMELDTQLLDREPERLNRFAYILFVAEVSPQNRNPI